MDRTDVRMIVHCRSSLLQSQCCVYTILSVDTRSCGSSRGGTIHLSGTFNATLPLYSRRSVHRMRGTTAISLSMDAQQDPRHHHSEEDSVIWCVPVCVGRLICWIDGACVCVCVCACVHACVLHSHVNSHTHTNRERITSGRPGSLATLARPPR